MTVYFQFPTGDADIKIMNVTGQLIDEQSVHNTGMATFNVHNYVPGVYLYEVVTQGKTQSGKLVIE